MNSSIIFSCFFIFFFIISELYLYYFYIMFSLEAKIRTEIAKIARTNGAIPAVLYGKDTPSTLLTVGVSEFIKIFRESGNNHIITLNVEKKSYNVLVQETQRHPVTGAFQHIDFLVVNMKAEVYVDIAINIVGTSPAILEGGQLHQSLDVLSVKCLPTDIVDGFDLDISNLTMGHSLHVSDLVINTKKFHILSHPEEAIVSIHAPKKSKELEETPPEEVEVTPTKAPLAE
ncbi:MAG: large subunit ribosomal protein [Patescibacteria group bacterium]|nr:large subunit ribosomal protein [Patescibacteria group bacterium]